VDQVRVARPGGRGRPRTRVAHLTGDKAYSSRANRAALRARRIRHTIPERDDQKADAVLGEPGARPFDLTGRQMKGWLLVDADGHAEDEDLCRWVDRGLAYASSLPPK
jgi:hypothetical protein